MFFEATSEQHTVVMDAKSPIGKGEAMTPKEMILAGLGGCTAMDVIALMKKHKQSVKSFEVEVTAELSTGGQPKVFLNAEVLFKLAGDIDPKIALESVQLSQTKFCGVSAMLAKAFPINYKVFLNNNLIGEGSANFN